MEPSKVAELLARGFCMRFKTLSDFKNYKNHISQEQKWERDLDMRRSRMCGKRQHVPRGRVCQSIGQKTSSDDSTSFWHSIKVLIQHEDKNPEQLIKIGTTGCMGPCENGPIVHVEPDGFYYQKVTVDDIEGILSSIKENMPYKTKAMSGNDGKPAEIPSAENIPFLAKQKKLVLGKMTSMSPLELEDHIAHGGYSALIKALSQ